MGFGRCRSVGLAVFVSFVLLDLVVLVCVFVWWFGIFCGLGLVVCDVLWFGFGGLEFLGCCFWFWVFIVLPGFGVLCVV